MFPKFKKKNKKERKSTFVMEIQMLRKITFKK